MASTLRTAAIVIGAAALIVATAGAAAPVATAGALSAIGVTASAATVATLASATAAALSVAATVATPKGTVGGNATKFKIDKDAGIPIVFGRTYVGGNVVHRQYYDDPGSRMRNQRESWVTVLSLGPVKSVGPLLIDKKPVFFNGAGAAVGDFAGNMWLDTQLGACPEARALRGPTGDFPGWNASSKLSGKAADLWTLDFDSKGKKFPTGVPARGRIVEGRFAYDPRLDGTFPGGIGACRIDDPTTHVYTENPWLQAITFAYGYYQNGHLVAGGELPITGIDLNAFVQAANTADLNGWKCGGLVYTTADQEWDILKMLAQAGGGEVFPVGGLLTCTHAAPRVSIGTITSDDIIGDVIAPSTASIRVRRNTIIPRVRLEMQGWEVVPIEAVTVPAYAIIDRATRPKETEYPLIQSAKQASEIAMYEMLDARELQPINLPCKLPTIGYRPGDCVTLNIPEANLVDRLVVLRERELDMGTFGVTFVARSEDPQKHPFALGTSATPPRTPDLSVPGLDLDPPVGWTAVPVMIDSPGIPLPAIVVSGLVDNGGAEAVQFDYRPVGTTDWLSAGTFGVDVTRVEITSVVAEASYDVSVRYRVRGQLGDRLTLGPVTIPEQPVSGLNGKDGAPGKDGIDGRTSYVHFAYADSPDGSVNFTIGEPAGRGWQGTYTDFVKADSGNAGDYVWSAYKGPAAFGLAGSGDTNVSGNALIKQGSGGWNTGGGYSTEGWRGGAQCSFSAGQSSVANIMAGLNRDPAANDSYDTIDYTWWLAEDGICRIYESGGHVGIYGTYSEATVFQIVYDGATVRYTKDGIEVRRVPTDGELLFYFDAALAGGPGTRLDAITFAAAGKAGTNGTDGKDGVDGVPGVKGADGTTYYPYFAYANSPDGSVDFTTGAPGGRAYVGFASGTSATEPDNWLYYAWTPYRGPAFGLTSRGQCVVAGDQVIKSGGAEAWDSDAYSTVGYLGSATASFRPGSADILVMVGLNADPAADASYTSLDYAWYLARNGAVGIFESGTLVAEPFVGYDDSFVFQVAYDGTAVRYLCNGAVYREVPTTANRLFYFDSSIAGPGSRVMGVDFRSAGTAGANGADGRNGTDGAPGRNGADGRTSYTHYAYADTPNGQVNFTIDAPGGRAYIGTYTDFVAADSPDPNSYTWTPYKGPPAFGLTGSGDTFVAGNALVKQGSSGWGGGGGYSTEGYVGGAQCTFISGQGTGADVMAGLNSDPTSDNSYATIDYAWYMAGDGGADIYENGAYCGRFISGYGFGTFQVVYDNRTVRYLYNGVAYRTVAVPADQLLYFDAALAGGPGTRLNSIAFLAAGKAGSDGTNGANGTNGTDGRNGADGTNGRDGVNGANGTDGYSIETDTPIFAIPCFSNGNPDPARWSGGSGQARLRKGGAVIGGVAFAIVSQSGMTGLSLNGGTGAYSFSGLSTNTGFFVVRASYAGQTFDLKVDVKKVRDGSAAFKAAVPINSSDASSQTTVPGGRVVRVSGAASYFLNHEGAYQPRMRIYVRNLTDGGPDQFLGSVLGSNAYRFNVGSPDEPVYDTAPGSVAAAFEFTSAAADKQYQYRCTMEGEYGGYADSISGQLMLEVIA